MKSREQLRRPLPLSVSHRDIEFVPGIDLLTQSESSLTSEEVVAIGMTLMEMIPQPSANTNSWLTASRLEGVAQRF